MAILRFRRRIKLMPGVSVNLGKRGASVSVGRRGAHVTYGAHGTRTTIGVPGTGVSVTDYQPHQRSKSAGQTSFGGYVVSVALVFALAWYLGWL